MKKIIIGISLVIVTLCLCGCGTSTNNNGDIVQENHQKENNAIDNLEENKNELVERPEISGEQIIETAPLTNITENTTVKEISDNWEDGEFLYNGKNVKLICNFRELEKNLGLKFNDQNKNEYVLNPNYTVSAGQCSVGNTENIVINLINSTGTSQKYPDCDVDTFSINLFNLKKNNDTNYSKIQLAKGINWDSTADEIIAAYGEPHKRSDNEYGFNLYYKASDSYSKLEFGFTNNLGLTSIYYTID